MQHIDHHNTYKAPEAGFELGQSHLMDLTRKEINSRNGFNERIGLSASNDDRAEMFLSRILNDQSELPSEVDWRRVEGRVSRVKDQGVCGSCWAFSTTGVLEGQLAVRHPRLISENQGKTIELSEQNLVDCTKAAFGCEDGVMSVALDQVANEGEIDLESSYPYYGFQMPCEFNKSASVATDSGFAIVPSGDEEALKRVVAKFGPVAVAIDASHLSFHNYIRGVHCNSDLRDLNHGVLIVGYGVDKDAGDYWIVKNSWGPQYGDNGYIKMARNRNNNCGIATIPTIPVF